MYPDSPGKPCLNSCRKSLPSFDLWSELLCAPCLVSFFVTALFLHLLRDPNVRKQKFVAQGDAYFKDGKYPEAQISYSRITQIDPRYAVALHKSAQLPNAWVTGMLRFTTCCEPSNLNRTTGRSFGPWENIPRRRQSAGSQGARPAHLAQQSEKLGCADPALRLRLGSRQSKGRPGRSARCGDSRAKLSKRLCEPGVAATKVGRS